MLGCWDEMQFQLMDVVVDIGQTGSTVVWPWLSGGNDGVERARC
jgi:hypothetical protein